MITKKVNIQQIREQIWKNIIRIRIARQDFVWSLQEWDLERTNDRSEECTSRANCSYWTKRNFKTWLSYKSDEIINSEKNDNISDREIQEIWNILSEIESLIRTYDSSWERNDWMMIEQATESQNWYIFFEPR